MFLSICISFVLLFSLPALAEEDAEEPCKEVILEDVNTVDATEGSLIYFLESGGQPATGKKGDLVPIGAELNSDAKTTADLRFCDGSVVRLGVNSIFKIAAIEKNTFWTFTLSLLKGIARSIVTPSEQKDAIKFRVTTPTGTLGVRGTEFVTTYAETGKTQLFTVDGDVLFGGKDQLDKFNDSAKPGALKGFTSVGKEQASAISKEQKTPGPVTKFDISKLKSHSLFRQTLERKSKEEVFKNHSVIKEQKQKLAAKLDPKNPAHQGLKKAQNVTPAAPHHPAKPSTAQNLRAKPQHRIAKPTRTKSLSKQKTLPRKKSSSLPHTKHNSAPSLNPGLGVSH